MSLPKYYFYRASICEGGLGSRNSVRLSVHLSHACIVTKLNDALQIFLYHTKGQSLCYSDTNSGWWATPLPLKSALKVTHPF